MEAGLKSNVSAHMCPQTETQAQRKRNGLHSERFSCAYAGLRTPYIVVEGCGWVLGWWVLGWMWEWE